MLRRSIVCFITVGGGTAKGGAFPKKTVAAPFLINKNDALSAVTHHYSGSYLFLNADSKYVKFGDVNSHFMPFFFCTGTVTFEYYGKITYQTRSTDADGKSRTSDYTVNTPNMSGSFNFTPSDATNQVYASYRFHRHHVERALKDDLVVKGTATNMAGSGEFNASVVRPLKDVAMAEADDVNLFEMNIPSLKQRLSSVHEGLLRKKLSAELWQTNRSAHRVDVVFQRFHVSLNEVVPAYLPVYVVVLDYDGSDYRVFVSGLNSKVRGPNLPNPETFGIGAGLAAGITAAVSKNIAVGAALGSAWGACSYFSAFYLARYVPYWHSILRRRRRGYDWEVNRLYGEGKALGFIDGWKMYGRFMGGWAKPNSASTPSDSSWTAAGYSDGSRQASGSNSGGSFWSSSRGSSSNNSHSSHSSSTQSSGGASDSSLDPKGYYKVLGVPPGSSIDEIKAAFRKKALQYHPDTADRSIPDAERTKMMVAVNEAYGVLRDVKKRAAYDGR